MIEWEQKMEVQILKNQGYSLRQIAQQTGLSVNTVIKYLQYEGKSSQFFVSRKGLQDQPLFSPNQSQLVF